MGAATKQAWSVADASGGDAGVSSAALCDDPPPPPGSVADSIGRTVVPAGADDLAVGNEVEVWGLQGNGALNGATGVVVGLRPPAACFVHLAEGEAFGGREVSVEVRNLRRLEDVHAPLSPSAAAALTRPAEVEGGGRGAKADAAQEAAVAAVRVRGLVGRFVGMNGLYRKAGIRGTKFEQRLSDGVGSCVLWRDGKDGRWKMNDADCVTAGWLPSSPSLLGAWVEDAAAHDGTAIAGMPYPVVTKASAAEHTHTES
eukprot:Rhum_TRINITY_DN15252_c2_g1::Rhum_TRINITY_DN15252_c2_g1_i1::g.146266::m.146266